MDTQVLVGSTGLVGQNLLASHHFDIAVHSTNVAKAYADDVDLVVYAGVPGTKYLANLDPDVDRSVVEAARSNLRKINAKEVVLVSTVDVYGDSRGKTEENFPGGQGLTAYGANRLLLENWVREDFPEAKIIRLPAIYGKGLKKNFVHDLIHPAPPMLEEAKYIELAASSDIVKNAYLDARNGYYSCVGAHRSDADVWFSCNDFNSLSLTDSRSRFQFYDLSHLWREIQWVLKSDTSVFNIATPPVSAGEVYRYIFQRDWTNHLDRPIADYDMRTRVFSAEAVPLGYCQTREKELEDIKRFVLSNRRETVGLYG